MIQAHGCICILCGFHEYQSVWEYPIHREQSSCARELRNPHDPMAVVIQKNNQQ